MGLFSRNKKITSGSSEREINEYLSRRIAELAEIKKTAADVIATEVRQQRKVEECQAQIERFQGLAEKAVAAGSEEDARVFLKRKYELEQQKAAYVENHRIAEESAEKMKATHNAMVREINELRTRLTLLKSREAAADAQHTYYNKGMDTDTAFEEWESAQTVREAEAEAKKYASMTDDDRLSEEIEALFKKSQGEESAD